MLRDIEDPDAPPGTDPGPRWLTETLLRRAQHELDRADDKANTLFRLYGVVLAAGVGFAITGKARSFNGAASLLLLLAAVCGLLAGGLLAASLMPRESKQAPVGRAPGYFGDIVRIADRAALVAALEAGGLDLDTWLVDQLQVTSVIVSRRYRLLRLATGFTAAAVMVTLVAAIADRIA